MLAKESLLKFSKMILKLCLLLGSHELIGLVQLPNAKVYGQAAVIFNIALGLLNVLLPSSRVVFIFVTAIQNIIMSIFSKYVKRISTPQTTLHETDTSA